MSTTPKEALEQLRESMRARPGGPPKLYKCGVCLDSGWEEIKQDGRGLVQRCRRGCDTPNPRQAARLEQLPAKKAASYS